LFGKLHTKRSEKGKIECPTKRILGMPIRDAKVYEIPYYGRFYLVYKIKISLFINVKK